MENIQLTQKDDVTCDLRKNRLEKDKKTFNNILKTIKRNMNPFDENVDQNNLFNIVTGKALTEESANFLLEVNTLGNKYKEDFIKDCSVDLNRFEQAIKRSKILNFASECVKKKQLINREKKCNKNGKRCIW